MIAVYLLRWSLLASAVGVLAGSASALFLIMRQARRSKTRASRL